MKRVVYARRGGLEAIEIIDEENPTPDDNQVRIEDTEQESILQIF